jgi:hypothetical protein
MKRIDVKPGEKHNMLTFVRYAGYKKNGTEIWECKCDCGNTAFIRKTAVVSGRAKSCGCLNHKPAHNRTHNMVGTRIYRIYRNMRNRCLLPCAVGYKNYGGRGITVCDEWLGDGGFERFYEWSMKNGYNDDLTLDRVNVDGNYEPNNCRWTTIIVQNNNRRTNRNITFNGETHTLAEWGRITGIDEYTIGQRLNDFGWSIEKSLTTPSRREGILLTYNNETHNITDWSKIVGIKAPTIYRRIKQGWEVERALTQKVNRKGAKQ